MMNHYLLLLLGKELQVIRNTYFSSLRKILITIGILSVVFLFMTAITVGLQVGLKKVIHEIPVDMEEMVIGFLLVIIFIWLAVIIFFSVIVDSRNKFFQTTDLELLMATPVPSSLVFSFRFIIFMMGSSSTLVQLCIFGFCPLLALGIVTGAPWQFFVFILPVAYLYLMIPAAVGVFIIMLLLCLFNPKTIFRTAGLFNLLLTIVWISFIAGDQEGKLSILIQWVENRDWFWPILRPLHATSQVATALLGYHSTLGRPFLELFIMAALTMALAVLIIRRLYYPVYDRLQIFSKEKKKLRQRTSKTERVWGPVFIQWRMALRNNEMMGAVFSMGSLLLVYYIIMFSIRPEGGIFLFLLNLGVVGICLSLLVFVLFMPASIVNDLDILRRQFWLLKTAPISSQEAVLNSWLAHFWPQIILAVPTLGLGHFLAGLPWNVFGFALIIFLVLQGVVTLLNIMSWYAEYAWGKSVSPLLHLVREVGPFVYYPVFLFFLGLGFFYHRFSFLAVLHSWDKSRVLLFSGMMVLGMLVSGAFFSWKKAVQFWEQMEI